MAAKNYERRSYAFEVRAEESEGASLITGRPIVTGSRTDLGPFDRAGCAGSYKTYRCAVPGES